ncbi:MAG TPA: transaldolase, partial [Planctomycetota bacterium]|nr:transaldolase [Planctomycetota bacterium]
MTNPLRRLAELGQSVWLDYIRRDAIESGELDHLIRDDGLRGVTSNPAIFAKAFEESDRYDDDIARLRAEGRTTSEIYRRLTVDDVQRAADRFRGVYDETSGRDGFVSLEVSPHLARDTDGTIAEARELWRELDRPNVLIKVPATREGLPAIRQLIGEGIHVNVTLLFGLQRYREVAEAYVAGLEDRLAAGEPIDRSVSVASFFLSRIDTVVDSLLDARAEAGGPDAAVARELRGKAAIACAKSAWVIYREIFGSDRFRSLAARGAHPQRLLWASTSTKDPRYPDLKYVEPLVGAETVTTLPRETLEAYRDHGNPAPRLEESLDSAERVLHALAEIGIDIVDVSRQLE